MAKDNRLEFSTDINKLVNLVQQEGVALNKNTKEHEKNQQAIKDSSKTSNDFAEIKDKTTSRITEEKNVLANTTKTIESYNVAIGKTITSTKKVKDGHKELIQNIKTTTVNYDKANMSLQKQIDKVEKYMNTISKVRGNVTGFNGSSEIKGQTEQAVISAENLTNRYAELNMQLSKTKGVGTEAYSKIRKEMDSLVPEIGKATRAVNESNAALNSQKGTADRIHYSWKKAFTSFSMYMSVTTVFYTAIRSVSLMIQEVEKLDNALLELRKVTDLEGESLEKFVSKAYDLGSTVAKTGTEMVESATEFAKAGYDESQILDLGKIVSMYTNIADEEVSTADAAEILISQMKAFNIEAKDSIHIIDAINKVSNKYAVSSSDIATNLGKSSAVMANAGNTLEQSMALLTAGTEITRNASKVSNGLKTITLRLQGMNDEGEKELDLVPKLEGAFNKLGLSLYNNEGNLKNTYDILKDLAPKYKDMNAETKAYYTELIAGKYQAQNASAILNNFTTAINANETAMNSAGSALKENEKVLESIKGRLAALSSAWEKFSTKFIDSDFIKFVINLGKTLLDVATSDMGQFIIKGGLTLTVLGALKFGYDSLSKSIAKFKISQILANKSMISFLGPVSSIIAAIGLLVGSSVGIEDLYYNTDKLKKSFDKSKESLTKVNEELSKTQDRIKELKGYNYLSLVEQDELDKLEQKNYLLSKQAEELQKIADKEEKRYRDAAKRKSEKLMSEAESINVETSTDSKSNISQGGFKKNSGFGLNTEISGFSEKEKKSTSEMLEWYDKATDKVTILVDKTEKLKDVTEALKNQAEKYKEAYDLAVESGDTSLMAKSWNAYLDILKRINKEEYDRIVNVISNADKEISTYDTLNEVLNKYSKTKRISEEDTNLLIDAGMRSAMTFDEEGNAVGLDTNKIWELYGAKLELNKTSLTDSANRALAALQAEGKGVGYTIEQYVQLIKAKQAAAEDKKATYWVTGKEKELLDAYDKSIKIQKIMSGLSAGSGSVKSSGSGSGSSGKAWWEKQLDALKEQFSYNEITLQEYINGLSKLLSQLKRGSDEWREVNNLLQEQKLSKVEDDYKRGTISLDEYIASLKELIKTYKYGTEAWNDLADKIKKANEELLGNRKDDYDKSYDAAVKLINDEIDKVQELKDEREKYYNEQIASLEKLNDETERQITLTELQQNLINAQNEKNKRVFVKGIGWTWQADSQAINDAQKALTDFQNEKAIKDLEKARDDELATLNDVLEGWNNYKDAWSDIQNTFEDAQNRIMLTQQFGANFESDILNGRLSALEKFKSDYINIQSQIAGASGGIVPGINDYTGLVSSTSLSAGMPNSSNIASLISSHTVPPIVAPATGSGASYTYNFENLVLPSVTNSQQFIAELKSMINLTKNQ